MAKTSDLYIGPGPKGQGYKAMFMTESYEVTCGGFEQLKKR